jgi:orotidine-5'-phosphate decarboxylase
MRYEIPVRDRIITALDVSSEQAVYDIVNGLGDSINFYKVGKELFVSEGPDIVNYLKNKGKSVFLDLKFHDIPNTVSKAAACLVRMNIDMFTIHASGGRKMMEKTVKTVKEEVKKLKKEGIFVKVPKILAVTVLTSMTEDDLDELGINTGNSDSAPDITAQVKRLALLSKESGVDGIVASPLEVDMLRETIGDDMIIVTPGIRPESAAKDDQKRITTPKEAISKGADYLVIGRPILNAISPKEASEKIIAEIS